MALLCHMVTLCLAFYATARRSIPASKARAFPFLRDFARFGIVHLFDYSRPSGVKSGLIVVVSIYGLSVSELDCDSGDSRN